MNRKRRRRPSAYQGRTMQSSIMPVLVIICLSVCAGYLTAKYVVYPLLGYEPAELNVLEQLRPGADSKTEAADKKMESSDPASVKKSSQTEATETTTMETRESGESETAVPSQKVLEDQAEVKQTAGYALQFGSYSTEAAAKKSLKQLNSSGIKAKIVQKDGAYKIIGKLFDTKEEAKAHLSGLDESIGAFVTTVET
ncbi:MAG: SPOR domain-containing protein [Firmicutes bacterium]|nr:SPOR domain-containing protein [Bacillota bacterium]